MNATKTRGTLFIISFALPITLFSFPPSILFKTLYRRRGSCLNKSVLVSGLCATICNIPSFPGTSTRKQILLSNTRLGRKWEGVKLGRLENTTTAKAALACT
ncbi:hypothetical protein BC939DRAFT_198321 [Gamsiella multidivaricata]|uniref:uncharacterized protein n=1 Tax=Gamsiella multidivaricata TaxID=101098 RepID=UPI00221EBC2A|nr:uncharacterized protein BC939DRAFT_198321 [Gamsiella multidivaricata]KAI7821868.1 hypothetical protein BC939DRAFT_198321 [Gamsiella multidivaricata]